MMRTTIFDLIYNYMSEKLNEPEGMSLVDTKRMFGTRTA